MLSSLTVFHTGFPSDYAAVNFDASHATCTFTAGPSLPSVLQRGSKGHFHTLLSFVVFGEETGLLNLNPLYQGDMTGTNSGPVGTGDVPMCSR